MTLTYSGAHKQEYFSSPTQTLSLLQGRHQQGSLANS